MLKKAHERYTMTKSIINMVFFVFVVMAVPAFCAESNDEFEIKPLYIFENKAGRDLFEPRYKKEAAPALISVDITTFSLLGITESRGFQAALFKSRSGSPFGYIFIDGKLYGENNTVIADVNGEIKATGEVILIQGDREVLFKLNDELEGQNIRPDTKYNRTGN